MQKYYLLFWLCFPAIMAAQPTIIMLDKMNALDVGVRNYLTVLVSDLPPEQLHLTVSQGELRADEENKTRYTWTICEMTSPQAWLAIADSAGASVDTLFYQVHPLKEPYFSQQILGGQVTSKGLTGFFDGYCAESLRPNIIGFDVKFTFKGQQTLILHNDGYLFDQAVISNLQLLKPGDRACAYNITWKAGCNPELQYSDQILMVKIY